MIKILIVILLSFQIATGQELSRPFDTIRFNANNIEQFEKSVNTVIPLLNTNFKNESLLGAFHNRILFKELYLDKKLYDNGCLNAKLYVFIASDNQNIFIGCDLNNNGKFDQEEVAMMPTSQKKVISYKIFPKTFCDTAILLDSTIIHFIPFKNQVSYSDLSATDTMLQLSYSRGFVKEVQLSDTISLLSHSSTIRKVDSTYVYKYILKTTSTLKAVYPEKDVLNMGDFSYSILRTIDKDKLSIRVVDGHLTTVIKNINENQIDSLKLWELKKKKRTDFEFKNELVLLDFWATWCKPCINSMPLVEKITTTHKNVQVVSLCVDHKENFSKAREIVRKNKLTSSLYFIKNDKNIFGEKLHRMGVIMYPTYILLKKDGTVLQHTNDISTIKIN